MGHDLSFYHFILILLLKMLSIKIYLKYLDTSEYLFIIFFLNKNIHCKIIESRASFEYIW